MGPSSMRPAHTRRTPRLGGQLFCFVLLVLPLLLIEQDANAQSAPDHPDPGSGAVQVKEFVEYDEKGRLTHQRNAYGQSIHFVYDDPNTSGHQTDGAFLDTTYMIVGGRRLDRAYEWDTKGRLEQIEEANGNTKSFVYDGLSRLYRVKNASGETVSEYQYYYTSGDPGTDPNYVRSTLMGGESPNVTTSAYTDGLGREWQTHQHSGGGRIVQARQYDELGRPLYAFRPYRESGFRADIPAPIPFSEQVYEASPLNRPVERINEDGTSSLVRYDVRNAPLSGLCGQSSITGRYQATTTLDERDDSTTVYKDALGQTVATRSYIGDSGNVQGLTTCFEYDASGNLTRVIKPEGDEVTYEYDTRGLLIKRSSPDAGTTTMMYDNAGNLRYSQDANQANSGTIWFQTYDSIGRVSKAGETSASWGALDPNTTSSFETDSSTWRSVTVHDAYPDLAGYPWNKGTPWPSVNASGANLKERVAARAHQSNGRWQMHLFRYDTEGRVKQVIQRSEVAPALTTTTEYAYDRQGRITKQHISAQASTGLSMLAEEIVLWYTYNDRGMVDALYAKKGAGLSASRPKVADLHISYKADGQVSELQYRNMEPITYQHDNRGRIRGIGNGSPYFTASLDYFADGNVRRMDVARETSLPSGLSDAYHQTFAYDRLDRLVGADYKSSLASDSRFDMSASYSPNGNIEMLRRRDEAGGLVDDLTYTYGSGETSVNQLQSVSDGGTGTTSWDAKGGPFTYDANGNMLTAPAPYTLESATYDAQNLPETITSNGQTINYYYSADGQRYGSSIGIGGSQVLDYSILDGSMSLGRLQRTSEMVEVCSMSMNDTTVGGTTDEVGGSGIWSPISDPADPGGCSFEIRNTWSLKYWNLVLPSGEVVGRIL